MLLTRLFTLYRILFIIPAEENCKPDAGSSLEKIDGTNNTHKLRNNKEARCSLSPCQKPLMASHSCSFSCVDSRCSAPLTTH